MRTLLSISLALLPPLLPVLAHAAQPAAARVELAAGPASRASGPAATATAPADGRIVDADVVLVSGQQSGPGLWQVSKAGHVLWILGTVAPVPKKMEWYSPQAESVLARAQEIIGPPHIEMTMGAGSMFKAAFAMPTLLRARKNPDGKTLRDVLPAELYARWSALKPTYLGSDKDVEQWRPIFAASALYGAALKRAGLQSGTGTSARLRALTDKYETKYTSTGVKGEIKDPKRLAKSFAGAEVDDIACFRSVLDQLELDVANAAQRANAWAQGDMPELRRLFRAGDARSCFEAIAQTEAARSLGMGDGTARAEAQWLRAVDAALASNHTSFATLPVSQLLQPNGLLAQLQAKGYAVVAPE
ncbi:TraB/GumN family protein [Lysobacter koreensis]|uniref:TraB/GumN family protein n=1 Tax=Lysobacter koreensis TaxID=266122 RepID=A0ABW2YM94_9GAMM